MSQIFKPNSGSFPPPLGRFPITPYVVGPVGQAGYQTIQSGINAANAAGGGMVYVQPGTYTENLIFFSNIQLFGDSEQGTFIVGTHTPPSSGTLNINRVNLASATDIFFSAAAGTTAITVEDTTFNATNGYTFNLPNWTSGGSIALFNIGVSGANDGGINNTGGTNVFLFEAGMGSGTLNTMTISGLTIIDAGNIGAPLHTVTGSNLTISNTNFTQAVTLSNNTTGVFTMCYWSTGSSTPITMSSSASVSVLNSVINSSANPVIAGSGAGTLTLGSIDFLSGKIIANTLTLASSAGFLATNLTNHSVVLGTGIAAISNTNAGSDGQVLIGASGANPAFSNITSLGGTISFTLGANSLNMDVVHEGLIWEDKGANFSAVANHGYFITGSCIATLPASPAQGDQVEFFVDGAFTVTITANTGQVIQLATNTSSVAGTQANTASGDACTLVYRTVDLKWCAKSFVGAWNKT